ncbi:MAG: nitrite/sulfite reductase [Opitutaceae bacterium]|nr:nitrite/sulfite reductase [Opitutaceae bacterium]
MKISHAIWKERFKGKLPEPLGSEVDQFETEIELRKQGKIDEKVFAETRLRRGAYGQRYDNGHRHDGTESRKLPFADKPTKGPGTAWDAPGMLRIKIPFGGLTPPQLEVMAELAEEYSDGIAHVTTRQDFQLHFIHIENGPSLMRRLAAVGITTREACGNAVRNVTACPLSGVCRDEAFDVTPYAKALAWFLIGHPDTMEFGRKFKPAFSGCAQHACGLAQMHDIGYVAAIRQVGGQLQRGFKIVVGGGLGPVPRQARTLIEFAPVEEMLPLTQAVCRVFGRHGEKKNRNAARIKFLVDKWGIEKFREEVFATRKELREDPRWLDRLKGAEQEAEGPLHPPREMAAHDGNEKLLEWVKGNVRDQRQKGYVTAAVTLPLGDITADQLRALADIVGKYTRGTIRTTVEQNFLIRWVSKSEVAALFADLAAVDLGQPGAGSIVDVTACPGTDTCKLGISSSRGLGGELRSRLLAKGHQLDQAIKDLHIKVSGCFNSCGCHHVADLGFYGVSRTMNGYKVPHFQIVLGGEFENNAGSYGLPIIAIPSKRAPEAVDRITEYYVKNRQKDERFHPFVKRLGKGPIRDLLEPLTLNLPAHDLEPGFYSDWGDPRQYGIGDIGIGECAGEVVSRYQFEMTAAERLVFEAGLQLDRGAPQPAGETAYAAFLRAAKALVQVQYDDVSDVPGEIMAEFKERFFDTQIFHDQFVGPKFANFLFAAHTARGETFTADTAHHRIAEAQLFIEAVHSCYNKLRSAPPVAAARA